MSHLTGNGNSLFEHRVLHATYAAGRIIHREQRKKDLLRALCETLTDNGGYQTAWIGLFENGSISFSYGAGSDEVCSASQSMRDPSLLRCATELTHGIIHRMDVRSQCGNCPVAGCLHGSRALSGRLGHGMHVFGIVCVSVPSPVRINNYIASLFENLTQDIGLALYKITGSGHSGSHARDGEKPRTPSGAAAGDACGETVRKLLESERKYQLLFENAPTGIFRTTSTGETLFINSALARTLHMRSTADAKKYTDLARQHYVDPNRRAELMALLREKGRVENFEYLARADDGQIVWLSMNAQISDILEDDTFIIDGFITDITDRKKANEERELMMMAIEQAAEGIMICNIDGVIQYINPAFQQLSQYSREELIGSNIRVFRSAKHNVAFYRTIWKTLEKGEIWRGRMENQKKNGVFYTEEVIMSPVRNTAGQIVNFVTVSRDITGEIEMEKKLRQSEKMEAIGVLAGGISHDFNNILGGIIGYAEMAQWEASANSDLSDYLERILEAADRARKLVSQILTFSRQNNDSRRAHFLTPTIKEVIALLRASIPVSIDIIKTFEEETRPVLVDTTHVHEIILNLVTNASHAVGEKGILTVSLSEKTLPTTLEGRIGETPPGAYAVISIADNGCGMDEAVLQRIFEPFYTTKKAGEGTGMGLAVVFGIVKSHGGNIVVESRPGHGTTFEVYLPQAVSHKEDDVQHNGDISGGKERIMVVDDEKIIRQAICLLLKQLGYTVSVFSKSTTALDAFRKNPADYDLIITDQTMPEMSGYELAQQIQTIKEVPIILCTGYSKYVDEHDALGAGIKAFMQKPFRIMELAQTIRSALET